MTSYKFGVLEPVIFLHKLDTIPDDVCVNVEFKLQVSRKTTVMRGTAPAIQYIFDNMIADEDHDFMILNNIHLGLDGITLCVSSCTADDVLHFAHKLTLASLFDVLSINEDDLVIVKADGETIHDMNYVRAVLLDNEVRKIHYSADVVHDGTVDNHLMQELHHSDGLIIYLK